VETVAATQQGGEHRRGFDVDVEAWPPVCALSSKCYCLGVVEYQIPSVDLEEYEVEREALGLVSRSMCERLLVLPVSRVGGSLIVAMVRPDAATSMELGAITGLRIEPVIASRDAIHQAIDRWYPRLN
jgi:hypothetical protein